MHHYDLICKMVAVTALDKCAFVIGVLSNTCSYQNAVVCKGNIMSYNLRMFQIVSILLTLGGSCQEVV